MTNLGQTEMSVSLYISGSTQQAAHVPVFTCNGHTATVNNYFIVHFILSTEKTMNFKSE